MAQARMSGAAGLAHINIAGRGSTLRKLVLAMASRSVGMPYLLHVHDYNYAEDYNRRNPLTRALVRQMFRGAVKTLVLGSSELRAMATVPQAVPRQDRGPSQRRA